jgi:hypothetical protein
MHNSIVPFEQERFDLVISDLTKNSEGLLLNILTQINNFINNDDRKLALKINHFIFCFIFFFNFLVKKKKNILRTLK